IAANAAVSGAQSANAAKRCRTNDGTKSFRADRKRREAGGDNGAGTGRRAAGPTLRIPRILRFALQRSRGKAVAHSSREFDHGGFTEENGADAVEMLDNGGVVVENLAGVWFRAPGAGHAFYGEQIF